MAMPSGNRGGGPPRRGLPGTEVGAPPPVTVTNMPSRGGLPGTSGEGSTAFLGNGNPGTGGLPMGTAPQGGQKGSGAQSMPSSGGQKGSTGGMPSPGGGGGWNNLNTVYNRNSSGPNVPLGGISPVDVRTEGLGLDRYDQFADEAYASQVRRLDPQFESADARFRQQMVNQGITEGSDAFDDARANFDRARTDAYGEARVLADQVAMAMQNQAFGQNLSESQLANALALANIQSNTSLGVAGIGANASMYGADVQRYLGELGNALGWGRLGSDHSLGMGGLNLANRNSDQSFLLGLGGLGLDAFNSNQGAQNNNWNQIMGLLNLVPGQAPAQLDVTGPYRDQYNGRMNQYNADQSRQQQNTQFWTSLFLCDRDAKRTIGDIAPETMLQAVQTMPVDRWAYTHDQTEHVGPYAQPFYASLGLPERRTIDPVDALGVVLGAIKALAARVEALEA